MTMRFKEDLDCLIIGAGFGGCYQLHLLRDAGFKTKIVDAANDLGGVWAWNRYPGARVDVEMPYYGFSDPKVWSTWAWTERYPSGTELLSYFHHVDKVWDLSKDIELGVRITSAAFERETDGARWHVTSSTRDVYRARYLVCATGTSFKQYIPTFEGLDNYRGKICHSSLWPKDLDIAGKRVAVVGAGSTGVQVVQEAAKRNVTKEELYAYRPAFQHVLDACRTTQAGLPIVNTGIKTFDLNDEQRREIWEELWERGGFNWSIGGFADTILDPEANKLAYAFWLEKTRARMKGGKKRDLLAPLEAPYYILTKRPSLEQDYYEMCDRDNVEITNSPITHFTETGIATADGSEDFDIIAICTGYDAVTGGLVTMNIKGENDVFLHDKWKSGISTVFGLMVDGFPNMFMLYGPQAPTSLSNGPPFLEMEAEWVRDVLVHLREQKAETIDAKPEAAAAWREQVLQIANSTLIVQTNSWYMGANIPGKSREFLLYMGGLPTWHKACREAITDWKDFHIS